MGKIAASSGDRWPRMLNRAEAACYVGIGVSKFDQMVGDGDLPRPKLMGKRLAWDRFALDAAIDELPEQQPKASSNPWDRTLA